MKVNYTIATWGGNRRRMHSKFDLDRSFYVKTHLDILDRINHNLNQITLVIAESDRDEDFEKIEKYPNIEVIHRENYGQSYGSFSHAYGEYKDKFDYYIFVEDDQVPNIDNFDKILINLIDSKENCGFLSCLVDHEHKDFGTHSSISTGICKTEALEKIWDAFGCIICQPFVKLNNAAHSILKKINPDLLHFLQLGLSYPEIAYHLNKQENIYSPELIYNLLKALNVEFEPIEKSNEDNVYSNYSTQPQVYFSKGFLEVGYNIADFSDEFLIPFTSGDSYLEEKSECMNFYGNTMGKTLFVPIEFSGWFPKLI